MSVARRTGRLLGGVRAYFLSGHSVALSQEYQERGAFAHLERCIELGLQAVLVVPEAHPKRATYLSNLAFAYVLRAERVGGLADLDRAVELGEQSIATTPTEHPDRRRFLHNLAVAYRRRYERTGNLADLDDAVNLGTQAISDTPEDHPDQARILSSLGNVCWRRYEHSGILADLDRAIAFNARAVATATRKDRAAHALYLSNLGNTLQARYRRSRAVADIERAIEIGQQSVAMTPPGHPNRAVYLSNLGDAYSLLFYHTDRSADLNQALQTMDLALAATPDNHPDRAGILHDLSAGYEERGRHTGTLDDLHRAVELAEQALHATHPNHPDLARYLSRAGDAYLARLDLNGPGIDLARLRLLAQQVSQAETSSPARRAAAGQSLGLLAQATNNQSIALALLDAAVALLPSIAPREAGWADQEYRLSQRPGLAAEAAAAHCADSDPSGAVEVAELGRGILLGTQLEARTDLTDLETEHHDLAAQFRRVRDQLNTPDSALDRSQRDSIHRIEDRKRLWSEHDELLARIRRYPTFARFLLPPRLTDLKPAVDNGYAVLVNTGRHRSDAIIVTTTGAPLLVTLPDLAFSDVASNAAELVRNTHLRTLTATLRRQRIIPEILQWLWTAIVKPVLDALPPVTDTEQPPRVWWMPTGLLGLFPLHAAHQPGNPGALDRVVSSYTPSLRALAYTRARPDVPIRRQLIVGLEHTSGMSDLPGAITEATDLHASQPNSTRLTDSNATITQVQTALPDTTWAHFACHAVIDFRSASQGGLWLHDGILPISQISRLKLHHAELAYLSACSTAHRGWRHADESLNLASAFQTAGFRHVIASLWPVDDDIAAATARSFYHQLPDKPTADAAATTLRQVTIDLRAQHPDRPDLWASLVHSGP